MLSLLHQGAHFWLFREKGWLVVRPQFQTSVKMSPLRSSVTRWNWSRFLLKAIKLCFPSLSFGSALEGTKVGPSEMDLSAFSPLGRWSKPQCHPLICLLIIKLEVEMDQVLFCKNISTPRSLFFFLSLSPIWSLHVKGASSMLCSTSEGYQWAGGEKPSAQKQFNIKGFLSCFLSTILYLQYNKYKMFSILVWNNPRVHHFLSLQPLVSKSNSWQILLFPCFLDFNCFNWYFASIFKVREDDVWISSFPKCGTTWTQVSVMVLNHWNVSLKCLSTGNGLEYRAQPGFQNSQICQFGGEGDSHNNVWNYLLKMNMQASCGIL